MSGFVTKASLATLPHEILRLIFPGPITYTQPKPVEQALTPAEFDSDYDNRWLPISEPYPEHSFQIEFNHSNPRAQAWLPITSKTLVRHDGDTRLNELRLSLRSLTQTCKSLRAFALPLLWAVVHVWTVDELARLRETLKVSPEIGGFVRIFVFGWHLFCENVYEHYDAEEGSLLDLAFRNRTKMWNDLRKKHGCKLQNNYSEAYEPCTALRWFDHNNKTFMEPGEMPRRIGAPEDDEWGWDDRKPRIGANGPDGKGKNLNSGPRRFQCVHLSGYKSVHFSRNVRLVF